MEIQKEQVESILEVLSEYYDEDQINYIEDSDMIFFPIGTFMYVDDIWTVSFDFTFILDHIDIRLTAQITQEVIDCGIDLTVMEGYWTICDEEMIVLDTIWESQVQEKMEESEMCFHEAFLFLLDKVFKDNSKEKPNNTNLH